MGGVYYIFHTWGDFKDSHQVFDGIVLRGIGRSQFTAIRYFKRILLETASHLVGWIAGILIAQLFAHLIDHGVYPIGDHSFYSVGLLMLIIYDLSVILSLITQKFNIKRYTSEIGYIAKK